MFLRRFAEKLKNSVQRDMVIIIEVVGVLGDLEIMEVSWDFSSLVVMGVAPEILEEEPPSAGRCYNVAGRSYSGCAKFNEVLNGL